MASFASAIAEQLWRNAFAVIPMALLVAGVCRWARCRPATRHTLWLVVLLWFVLPLVLPVLPGPGVFRPDALSEAPLAANELLPQAPTRMQAGSPEARVPSRLDSVDRQIRDETRRTPTAPPDVATPERAVAAAEPPDPDGFPPARRSARPLPGVASLESSGSTARDAAPIIAGGAREMAGEDSESVSAPPALERRAEAARRTTSAAAAEPGATVIPRSVHQGMRTPAGTRAADPTPRPPADRNDSEVALPAPARRAAGPAEAPRTDAAAEWNFAVPGVTAAWSSWIAGLLAIRDILGRLPTLPLNIWAAGLVALLLVRILAVVRFSYRLSRAYPAPRSVRRLVRGLARGMGLRRAPEIVMVDQPVSPMIWCGRRPRLVLPLPLWSQLDAESQKAVVCHELAHLRRRDHWICWLGLAISGLYWWHPLAWWVRRRIDEEAELCCDAWVTWLNPRDRRAYAQALLMTRQYVRTQSTRIPGIGLGMASARMRSLSRRLSMVMTASERPRVSIAGIALVLSLGAIGWLTTPAWSFPCDPEEKDGPKTIECDTPGAVLAPAPLQWQVALPGASDEAVQAYLQYMARPQAATSDPAALAYALTVPADDETARAWVWRVAGDDDEDDEVGGANDEELHRQLARLEEELDRLADRLREVSQQMAGGSRAPAGVRAGGRAPSAARAPRAPAPPDAPSVGRAPQPPAAPRVTGQDMARGFFGGRAQRGMPAPGESQELRFFGGQGQPAPEPSFQGGGIVSQSYRLPEGKLDALSKLMIRADVPIRVRPGDGAIEVQATPAQQRTFERFVHLIDGGWEERDYALPEGKMEAFSQLMVRDDVPIVVSPGGAEINIRATPRQHDAIRDFLNMINPQGRQPDQDRDQPRFSPRRPSRSHGTEPGREEEPRGGRSRRDAELRQRERAEVRVRELERSEAAIEARAANLQAQAETFEAQAEEIAARAEELAARAEGMADRDRARDVERQVRDFERQAREFEQKSRRVEAEMRQLERQAERIAEQREAAEARDEAYEDVEEVEEAEHELEAAHEAHTSHGAHGSHDAETARALEMALRSTHADAAVQNAEVAAEAAVEALARLNAHVEGNPHPAVAEALRAAAAAVEHEAQPAVAEALRAAAEAVRTEAQPAVDDALREAVAALRSQRVDHPQAERALRIAAEALERSAAPATHSLLERVAEALEKDVPRATGKALEELSRKLKAKSEPCETQGDSKKARTR